MNWSFRIATVAGIPIRVHITFPLILVLGGYQWGSMTGTAVGAVFGVLLMVLLFICVTLHELGHSVVAQAFHIPVREITLLPLGGVSQLSKNPEKPSQDLLIALAGPAVNVILSLLLLIPAGLAFGPLMLNPQGLLPSNLSSEPGLATTLLWLLAANVSLVVFNLIPAFPLDGGRALRAILAMFMGYPRATQVSSAVGQAIAIALGVAGVVSGNIILALVAVFIFFGAGQAPAASEAKTVLDTLRVGDAYNKNALTLRIGERVSRVVDYILTSYQPDYAVMQGSNPIGIVTRSDVIKALASEVGDAYVTEIMERDFLKVDAARTLHEARDEMMAHGARIAAVYEGDHYLGLVSLEDIAEALAVLTFVERQKKARAAQAAGGVGRAV